MYTSISILAAALVGTAAALPGDMIAHGYPAWGIGSSRSASAFSTSKHSSSSSVTPSASSSWATGVPMSTPSSSWLTGIPNLQSSSAWSIHSTPSGTGSTRSHPHNPTSAVSNSSSMSPHSMPTGYSHPYQSGHSYPAGTGTGNSVPPTTETDTVYTTTTICPVTYTSSGHVTTTLTTSTIVVTSCKNGCHHSTATPTSYYEGDTTKVLTTVYPTTLTKYTTKFVPCSTPVSSNSGLTYYSTWLTATSWATSAVSTVTSSYTVYPQPTHAITTSIPSAPSTVAIPPTTITGPASGTCAPAETVYSTIVSYSTVYGPAPTACKACETVTVTLGGGRVTTVVVPPPAAETHSSYKPGQSHSWSATSSSSVYQPTGTGAHEPFQPIATGTAASHHHGW